MKTAENLSLDGNLEIYKAYTGGPKFLIYKDENLITLLTRQLIVSWFSDAPQTTDPINGIKVGTGGTLDPQGLFPKTEDQAWVALNATITTIGTVGLVPISKVYTATVPSMTFLADIDQSMANGSSISEAGLFRTSGGMFNIKTFPAIPKTSEFSLHFEWTIKVA